MKRIKENSYWLFRTDKRAQLHERCISNSKINYSITDTNNNALHVSVISYQIANGSQRFPNPGVNATRVDMYW